MPPVEPCSDKSASGPKAEATDSISDAERELYGGRLRYDQSYVRHEGPLTRLKFGHMAAALPHMVGMVLRTGWKADRRALMGVVAAELGQGVTAAWGLVAVNGVLAQLFADGPTVDKLRDALPSLVVLAVAAVAGAVLSAWSTAMSGRLEPQVERAVSARYYRAVTGVEVEATERPEVQRVLEAGKFGRDSARSMLRLSVGVGNVVIGMAAAAVVLAALHPALLPMLLAVVLPKGWGAVRAARRDYLSRMNWVDHRRAIASLLAYLTRPHAAGELRVHAAGGKLLSSYEEMSRQTEAEQRRLARVQASTDLVAGAFAGVASLACYGVLWWLLATGGLPLAVGGTAVIAIRTSTARLTSLVQQVNRLYEELLFLTDTEDAIKVAGENAIPLTGAPLPAPVREVRTEAVSFTCVPEPWVEQLAPGGRLLTTLATRTPSWPGHLLVSRTAAGMVEAVLRGRPRGYRPLLGYRWLNALDHRACIKDDPGTARSTPLAPPPDDAYGFWLAAAYLAPGLVRDFQAETMAIVAPEDDSWAVAGPGNGTVRVHGPRDVWAELEDLHARWEQAGRPERYLVDLRDSSGVQHVTSGAGPKALAWMLPPLAVPRQAP
ncbi:hypothetical protein ACIA6D_41875 [Streptomyces cacaoi]|uniref:hypothetical protein n=1 Tax=Streptomyces cacaoi TaxID=1898 RepID=UPI003748D80A